MTEPAGPGAVVVKIPVTFERGALTWPWGWPVSTAAEPKAAGLVIMAGGAQPLHWAAVRQFRYLASLEPRTPPSPSPVGFKYSATVSGRGLGQ